MIAFDTETHPLGPGAVLPPIVCLSVADATARIVLGNSPTEDLKGLAEDLLDEGLGGHNVAFDLGVLQAKWPDLLPKIFKALDEGRIHDTSIREKLHYLQTWGKIESNQIGQQIGYKLSDLAERRAGIKLTGKEGEDVWRLRYNELDGIPAERYPEEAYHYALMDAVATYEVAMAQKNIPDVEGLHVKGAFSLQLMSAYGLLVDPVAKEEVRKEAESYLGPENLPLIYELGLVLPAQPPQPYSRGVKAHVEGCPPKARKTCTCPPKMRAAQPEKVQKSKVLIPLIERICLEQGMEIKKTKGTGKINAKTGKEGGNNTKADADTLKLLAPYCPALDQYLIRAEWDKILTSYFPSLEWPFGSGQTAEVVHPNYNALKKTGRVSSWGNTKKKHAEGKLVYPSVAIQTAHPKVRRVYMPRPGNVYLVADYTAIDLCALAQTIKDLFGHSTHLDLINRGVDLHSWFAVVLAADAEPEFDAELAANCKTKDEAYDYFMLKKETDPEWYKTWRTNAKPPGLGFPGGMGLDTMVAVCWGYGVKIDRAGARKLKKLWIQTFPEMRRYLSQWVEAQKGCYTSPLGMRRINCSYTELANGKALQTPAAEGMKEAMYLVTKDCYLEGNVLSGCRPVINMHDELVLEIPEDEFMDRRAKRLEFLMVKGMKKILPDVAIRAEPLLCRRWTKDAKPVFDKNGRLTVWEGKPPTGGEEKA